MTRHTIYRCVANVVVCWVSAIFTLCTVDPAGYSIRQQAQRSTDALKTKNQDTNGETYAENKLTSHSTESPFFFLKSVVPVRFSPAWGQFLQKKHDDTVSMTVFAQCSLLGPSSTALNFHSNWGMLTVAKCEVIWHSIWKKALCLCFMLYHRDQQWRRHHLGTESYSRLGLFTRGSRVLVVVSYLSWKFRSTVWSKLAVELVDLHPFQHHFLSFISSEKVVWFQSLVPFFFSPLTWTPSPLPVLVSCEG